MPTVKRLRELNGGWLIPIAIIAVLSFPPLFGNGAGGVGGLTPDIVLILVGVVWGLRKGFAIVVLGTLIGEMASFTCVAARPPTPGDTRRHPLTAACSPPAAGDGRTASPTSHSTTPAW